MTDSEQPKPKLKLSFTVKADGTTSFSITGWPAGEMEKKAAEKGVTPQQYFAGLEKWCQDTYGHVVQELVERDPTPRRITTAELDAAKPEIDQRRQQRLADLRRAGLLSNDC